MAQGSGTITGLNGTVAVVTEGYTTISFNITGTWSADVVIEATNDDQNWFTVEGISPQSVNVFSVLASNVQIVIACGGYSQVRLRAYVFNSGIINVTYDISSGNNIGLTVVQGNVTTEPPVYSTGNIAQLSLTLAGALRTQALKDAGRTYVTFTADAIAGVTSEAMISFTKNRQGTTTSSVTSYTVTSGKTLRLQSLTIACQSGSSIAEEWVRIKIRHNTAGSTTTSSALVYTASCGTNIAATAAVNCLSIPLPDGLEIFGDGTQSIGVSHLSSATSNVESITLCGYEY